MEARADRPIEEPSKLHGIVSWWKGSPWPMIPDLPESERSARVRSSHRQRATRCYQKWQRSGAPCLNSRPFLPRPHQLHSHRCPIRRFMLFGSPRIRALERWYDMCSVPAESPLTSKGKTDQAPWRPRWQKMHALSAGSQWPRPGRHRVHTAAPWPLFHISRAPGGEAGRASEERPGRPFPGKEAPGKGTSGKEASGKEGGSVRSSPIRS